MGVEEAVEGGVGQVSGRGAGFEFAAGGGAGLEVDVAHRGAQVGEAEDVARGDVPGRRLAWVAAVPAELSQASARAASSRRRSALSTSPRQAFTNAVVTSLVGRISAEAARRKVAAEYPRECAWAAMSR
ncbi:hypothetical protein GCM10010440_70940 [Kitasatospora cinereorecta]